MSETIYTHVEYSPPNDSNISHQPPTLWYDDVGVTVDRHVYSGTLKDGTRIYHECNGQNCRLHEEVIEAECAMRMRERKVDR